LIWLIKKKVEEHPRRWHEVLSLALWAHKTLKHGATKVTPSELVYWQEIVLPVEINLQTCRVAKQEEFLVEEYNESMMTRIDEVQEDQFKVLREIEKGKVRERSFQIGELVWKTILLPKHMK
jgi:predicted nucleic acid-binding protein